LNTSSQGLEHGGNDQRLGPTTQLCTDRRKLRTSVLKRSAASKLLR
jgi:hypothetical protein